MKKRIGRLVLAAALAMSLVCLAACGQNDAQNASQSNGQAVEQDQNQAVEQVDVQSEAAKKVDEMIAGIETVSMDSADAIAELKGAYKALSQEEKDSLENASRYDEIKAVFAVVKKIDAIGKVTNSSKSKSRISKAKKAYDALDEGLQAQVTNYSKLTKAQAKYDKAKKKAKKKALLKYFNKSVDDVRGYRWYEPEETPRYSNTRSYFLPYLSMSEDSSRAGLYLCADYFGKDWIFYDSIVARVDGKKYEMSVSRSNIDRDVCHNGVVEFGNMSASDDAERILRAIAKSKKSAKILFVGDHNTYKLTISDSDKRAIKRTIQLYDLLNS